MKPAHEEKPWLSLRVCSPRVERENDTTGENGDGDGSVRDFRSGWITADHNAPTVVESGRSSCGKLSPIVTTGEYRVSLLWALVSHHSLSVSKSVQNVHPSLPGRALLMEGVWCSMCGTNDATMGAAAWSFIIYELVTTKGGSADRSWARATHNTQPSRLFLPLKRFKLSQTRSFFPLTLSRDLLHASEFEGKYLSWCWKYRGLFCREENCAGQVCKCQR